MTAETARKCAKEIIEEYREKLIPYGIVNSPVEEEYNDAECNECEFDSPKLDAIILQLAVRTEKMPEDDGIYYGLYLDVDKNREVADEDFEEQVRDFKENLDDLIAAFNTKDDITEFLNEELEKIKQENAEALKALTKKINNIDLCTKVIVIVGSVLLLAALVCVILLN